MEDFPVEEEPDEDAASRPTKPCPPYWRHIPEFIKSPFMEQYEQGQKWHRRETVRRLSDQSGESNSIEPTHFHCLYREFLEQRRAREEAEIGEKTARPIDDQEKDGSQGEE
jgi:hypothetical protein